MGTSSRHNNEQQNKQTSFKNTITTLKIKSE